MGDRGQVKIEFDNYEPVYLYTHYGATKLIVDVYTALNKHWRWNDHEYLARIIFDVMTKDEHDTETGYGIGTSQHGDIWRLITIKANNTIVIQDNKKVIFKGTFEKYLAFAKDFVDTKW